jgi:hypothetical protein
VSEWQLLKGFHVIPTIFGLAHVIAMLWFGCKIMPNILKKLWKAVEEL